MDLTGLFFGSFNPVHNGHISIAKYLLDAKYCTKVWFVISPCNPWKAGQHLLDEQKRLEIVQKAIAGDPRMSACDIEFNMPRPSYTYQTLQKLKNQYPREHFALIMGGDNLQNFHLWKNAQNILDSSRLLVYPRPGVQLPPVTDKKIEIVNAPVTDISSTVIRNKVIQKEDISSLVPPETIQMIQKYYSKT